MLASLVYNTKECFEKLEKVEKPKWNAPGEPDNKEPDHMEKGLKETKNIESLLSIDTEKDIFNPDSQKQFIKNE